MLKAVVMIVKSIQKKFYEKHEKRNSDQLKTAQVILMSKVVVMIVNFFLSTFSSLREKK